MERKNIIYIVSPRSACSHSPGRKISSIIDFWRKLCDVETFFGGDITKRIDQGASSYGNVATHNQSFRRSSFLSPFVHSYSELKDILHNLKSYFFIKSKYSGREVDLIWERSSRFHCAGLMYAGHREVPYILEWKDNLVNYRFSLLKPLALWLEAYKCKNANAIVVESEVLRGQLANQGVEKSKIIVAHNACDADQFCRDLDKGQAWRDENGIDSDTILISYLGSYAFYHNPMLLVEAVSKLVGAHPELNFKCVMVGNGMHYQECRTLAAKNDSLTSVLTFIQPVPADMVPNILSATDIAVLPGSTDIIAPIKILEYMASGAATVVPDYACNRELISDTKSGLLFTPDDSFDLKFKLKGLIEDAVYRESLGKAGVETVAARFSWSETWGAALNKAFGVDK